MVNKGKKGSGILKIPNILIHVLLITELDKGRQFFEIGILLDVPFERVIYWLEV